MDKKERKLHLYGFMTKSDLENAKRHRGMVTKGLFNEAYQQTKREPTIGESKLSRRARSFHYMTRSKYRRLSSRELWWY